MTAHKFAVQLRPDCDVCDSPM